MKIEYSREKSDLIAKRDGSYVPKEQRVVEPRIIQKPKVEKEKVRPQKQQVIPNNILFVQGLPVDITKDDLNQCFAQFIGFRELWLIANKQVAFVEYMDEF